MICKFCAAKMFTRLLHCSIAVVLAGTTAAGAWAEKVDRTRPMTLESLKGCVVDLAKKTRQCGGGVVIVQGTLVLRADRVELSETAEGHQQAAAIGTPAQPAQYRQKRDGVDEHVEGSARRIDYDGRTGTLRFEGQAVVRRLRGTLLADEIHGSVIVWDSNAEQFSVQGGDVTAANPGGRVRAVLSPREVPAALASAPAAALRPTPALGERR